jgi:hypothetical protein
MDMEFIYPAGAHDWKIKITPKYYSRKAEAPCDMKIIDTFTMVIVFHCDYHSEDKCLEVWGHLKKAWEYGRCYWDDKLRRLVWKSELEFYENGSYPSNS